MHRFVLTAAILLSIINFHINYRLECEIRIIRNDPILVGLYGTTEMECSCGLCDEDFKRYVASKIYKLDVVYIRYRWMSYVGVPEECIYDAVVYYRKDK